MNAMVQTYFLDKDYNCAESTLHILNDMYSLNLREEDFKLVSGFGAGCGYGIVCGALAGCMAALGKLMITERAHVTPNFKETCGEFCGRFEAALGSTSCGVLRPQYFQEGIRCSALLEIAIECFDTFVKEKGLL